MIKTIEIAPDIVAHELAKFIFKEIGTQELNCPYNPPSCVIPDEEDLREVIKKFFNDSKL